jgi:two-component system, OmpR family, alkaline phosphatase synthesis response regulator PhoP
MSEKKKILIIDDDKDYGEALKIVLGSNGFNVHHVLNIRDGRQAIETDKPELIILDVMMDKHTDGFDLCYNLKHDKACSDIPILMVTAVTNKTGFKFSPETDGEYLQADDYAAKPIPAAELLLRVKKLIG